jgi:hypothetical protein
MNLGRNKQLTRLGRYSCSPAGPDPSSQASVQAPPGWAGASSPGVGHPALFSGRASAPRPPSASRLGRCPGPPPPPGWAASALPGWARTCAPAGPACLFSGWAFLAARAPVGPTIRLGCPFPSAPRLGRLLPTPGWAGSGGSGLAGILLQATFCKTRLRWFRMFRLGQAGTPLAQAGLSPCHAGLTLSRLD